MANTVKHGFTSALADDAASAAAGEVLPSHWNAQHTFAGATVNGQFLISNTGSSDGAIWSGGLTYATSSGLTIDSANVTLGSGQLRLPDGTAGAPSYSFTNSGTTGFYRIGPDQLAFSAAGSNAFSLRTAGLTFISSAVLQWTPGADPTGVTDTILTRDAANTLALRNSTAAQQFNVYNTYTDASNYERLAITWSFVANTLYLGAQQAGTGTARVLTVMSADGNNAINVNTSSNTPVDLKANNLSIAVASLGRVAISRGTTSAATSSTHIDLDIAAGGGVNPTATSTLTYYPFRIAPTINYSNATPGAGSYEALKIAVTETALPTGQSYLIRASAGVAGTTDLFAIRNNGVPEFKGTNSTGAGTALLGTNSPAVTVSAPYTWMTVITADGSTGYIPIWK